MAISRLAGQTATGTGTSGTGTATYPGATTAGDLLIAVLASSNSPALSGGGTWTNLISRTFQGSTYTGGIWYKLATGSETTVTATSTQYINLTILEYTGNANPIVTDGTAAANSSGSTTTTATTPNITTTNANDLVFLAATMNSGATAFSWATSTLISGPTSPFCAFIGEYIVSTIQTNFNDTGSWTGVTNVATLIGAFKAATSTTSPFGYNNFLSGLGIG